MNKEDILAEIRRTAEERGGEPPGMKLFRTLTGISEHDWRGKIWARWSDALVEAGYAPNEWQAAVPDEAVLDQLIDVIEKRGKFPTQAELKLIRSGDPTFPSMRVFRRLGPKPNLASRVIARCVEIGGHVRVLEICAPIAQKARRASPDPDLRDPVIGEVYLMKSGRYYKIGRSNSVGRREYELSTQRPEGLTRIHVIRTDDPAGVESYWHRRFADRRKTGEWFDLSPADVSAFKCWKRIV